MGKSSIEWLNGGSTWNPLRAVDPGTGKVGWHCVRHALECVNCYAETFNGRKLTIGTGLPYSASSPAITYLDADILRSVLDWPAGEHVFPCSMTDWCGEFVDPRDSFAILKAASLASNKRFLFLTKRPDRMAWLLDPKTTMVPGLGSGPVDVRQHARELFGVDGPIIPGDHLWLGCSAGTNRTWCRSQLHLGTVACFGFNTWVSAEPLIDAVRWDATEFYEHHGAPHARPRWVIIGGESGAEARPCDLTWVRETLAEWQRAGVPVFVKQLGRRPCGPWLSKKVPLGSPERWHLRSAKGADPAEWPRDIQVRQYPRGLGGITL
jgi:protein gp37